MEYRSIKKINQSLLKKILISPSAFVAQQSKQGESDKSHFLLGSVTDDMLLSPEVVDDKYFKVTTKLSESLKQITTYVHDIFSVTEEWTDTKLNNAILKACLVYDYQPRWGDDAKIKNIKKSGKDYFDALIKAEGRRIVSQEEYNKATVAVASIKADPITGLFLRETEQCTIIKRKVVEFEYQGIELKGELDEVYIDHVNKTITPIDYKTTGLPITMFNIEFWKYRYDFQAATYLLGLQSDLEIKEYLEKGYKLLQFKYIVVEMESTNSPLVFNIPDNVINIGINGGTRSNGWKIEGLNDAISRYKFHFDNNQWDYPQEYYEQEYLNIEI